MMPEERWLPVIDYEDRYEVSDRGRVRKISNAYRHRVTALAIPVALTPKRTGKGYLGIDLARNGKKTRRYIHDLVLETFVGPAPRGHEGAHGDGTRSNNALSNLAWKTPSQNHMDKWDHGTMLHGESHQNAKLTDATAAEIRASAESSPVLAQRLHVSPGLVRQVRRREIWRHV